MNAVHRPRITVSKIGGEWTARVILSGNQTIIKGLGSMQDAVAAAKQWVDEESKKKP